MVRILNTKRIISIPLLLVGILLLSVGCSISSSISGVTSGNLSKIPLPPLFLSPDQNKTLMSGESLQFIASGGVEPYTFTTNGNGQILSDGSYQAGFEYPTDEETITVTDAAGQTQSYTVPIKSFKTVENFNYTTGSVNTKGNKIISTDDGTLYVVGQSFSKWMVLKSTDSGVTWTALDATQSSVIDSEALGIAYHPIYGIYVSGYQQLSGNTGKSWLIRKSTDNGATWSTVYQYQLAANKHSEAKAISISSNGNIFVSGYAIDLSDVYNWNVIKSTDHGSTWSIIDSVTDSSANDIIVSNQNPNHIFVAGKSSNHWMIKGSYDNGNTWLVLDHDTAGKSSGYTNGLAMATNGTIYSVGYMQFSSAMSSPSGATGPHGITKISSNNGASWSTIDYQNSSLAVDFTSVSVSTETSNLGKIYVTSQFQDGSPNWDTHFAVRRSINSGSTWTQIDDYQVTTNISSYSKSVTFSVDDHVYSVGYGASNAIENASGIYSLIARKYNTSTLTNNNLSGYTQTSVRDSAAVSLTRTDSGHLYVLGTGKSNVGQTDWVIRKSTDSGANWSTSDTRVCGDYGCIAKEIVSETAGNRIYAIGVSQGNTMNDFYWMVRYSLDAGATWQHHTWQLAANRPAYGNSIKILSNGTILAAGVAFDSSFQMKTIIRRSTNYGSTWSTIENSLTGASLKLYIDENDHVYAIGNQIIRKSTNAGTSWTTIYTAAADYYHDISVVGGHIYTVARMNTTNYMQIRKSTDNGATWTVLDTFSEGSTTPESITVSATGEILVTGKYSNSNGTYGFVRMSTDAGVNWKTIEKLQYPEQSNISIGKAIYCESDRSKICYAGSGADENRISRWLFKLIDLTGL